MTHETSYDRLGQIPIEHLDIRTSALNALASYGRYKTMSDLELASDMELLAIPKLGKLAVHQIREQIRSVRRSKSSLREELIEWVDQHSMLIQALIRGEAVITLKASETESN